MQIALFTLYLPF